MNPAGFDKVSQDGADVEDFSGSNIPFNQLGMGSFYVKKKHRNERKMLTSYLLAKIYSKFRCFFIVKSGRLTHVQSTGHVKRSDKILP